LRGLGLDPGPWQSSPNAGLDCRVAGLHSAPRNDDRTTLIKKGNPMSLVLKDPGAAIDYQFDWGSYYLSEQAILASEWAVDPVADGGLTIAGAGHGALIAHATISGGAVGHIYRLTNRVTLTDGQIDERTISIRVEQR
jgi:hypothetical protein